MLYDVNEAVGLAAIADMLVRFLEHMHTESKHMGVGL